MSQEITIKPESIEQDEQGDQKASQLKIKKQAQDDRDIVSSGMIVSVHEKIIDTTPKGEKRERVQVFTGMVLARKHGRETGATITVRKKSGEVGVEKIFPVYSPIIERIVIDKRFKIRRAKMYFLRDSKKRLKAIK